MRRAGTDSLPVSPTQHPRFDRRRPFVPASACLLRVEAVESCKPRCWVMQAPLRVCVSLAVQCTSTLLFEDSPDGSRQVQWV